MNRDEAKELAKTIKAFGEGKDIQLEIANGKWRTDEDPTFHTYQNWRVKPEPRVFWLDTAHGTFTNYDPQIKGHVRVIEDLSDD